MASILFTWEIGEGSGHIAPYLAVIRELEARGHQVSFACKYISRAFPLFAGTRVRYLQAPYVQSAPAEQAAPIDSFAKILNNCGYSNVPQLAGMIRAWLNLFELVKPDLIVADYSPTAVLASRESGIPRLQIGNGFFQVPTQGRIPTLAELQGMRHDDPNIFGFQNRILSHINAALELNGMAKVGLFQETQQAERKLFTTFKELDHYPAREPVEYIGPLNAVRGVEPEWPDGGGAKVFAYLKPFPTLGQLFMQLNQKQLRTLIYPDGIPEKLMREHASATLKFVDKPLDMPRIGETADFAIHNGNHGTTCELMLAGLPSLVLPLHAEQAIMGRHLQLMGAGLSYVEKTADQFHQGLSALSRDAGYRQAAEAFAGKYRDFDRQQPVRTVLAAIEELLV
ncbi:hypothetical protein GCM10010960_13660 [Arenimonas maotaiensis]|uniref:Glycosyltransferase n=1 Tax=Arenimonas maotaiensis TaxID=1446479 RepID=A0A917FNI0_9GAMM|nr:nucleotide disphospho-sugar-binding domain-containing protein [Arenimonas maotaiensis]GGF93014.1 hypothetical protein GCM10010960_13660 [Arenimonas maotaiensis]